MRDGTTIPMGTCGCRPAFVPWCSATTGTSGPGVPGGRAVGGGEAGTPVVAVTPAADGERIAFNGPSLSRVPRGEEAGLLWDGALLVAGTPGFLGLSGRSG
jgi:hypothetical protein